MYSQFYRRVILLLKWFICGNVQFNSTKYTYINFVFFRKNAFNERVHIMKNAKSSCSYIHQYLESIFLHEHLNATNRDKLKNCFKVRHHFPDSLYLKKKYNFGLLKSILQSWITTKLLIQIANIKNNNNL